MCGVRPPLLPGAIFLLRPVPLISLEEVILTLNARLFNTRGITKRGHPFRLAELSLGRQGKKWLRQ